MLDLKKYLNRAEADPSFRQRLIQDANQAIKDEFGEDLPYKLKCKEKLIFEVELMDGVAESDLEGVAGGTTISIVPADEWVDKMKKAGYTVDTYLDSYSDCGYYFRCYNKNDVMPCKENYYPFKDASGKAWMEV